MSEAAIEGASRKLPLGRILGDAFVLPWRNRAAVLRAAGLPVLASGAAWLCGYGDIFSIVTWIGWVGAAVAFAWLAIAMHRLLLTHAWHPQPVFRDLRLGRVVRFCGASILIAIVFIAVHFGLLELCMSALGRLREQAELSANEASRWDWLLMNTAWFDAVVSVFAYCAVARFALVLPAIALDRTANYAAAWRISRGNGWAVIVAVGAFPWFLDLATGALWRDDATWVEMVGLAILTCVVAIVEIVALSRCYAELTRESAPPPTHPPG